ncbi:MAG: hypothetical protein JNL70_09990 [Saprospiraceae bacterium]|nr:hypothetical protein [Saprospiraceae bacterium]
MISLLCNNNHPSVSNMFLNFLPLLNIFQLKTPMHMNEKMPPLSIGGQRTKTRKSISVLRPIRVLYAALFLSGFCLLFTFCGKNETESLPDLAKEYYPLQIGKTLIYNIDTILYDPQPGGLVKIDTFRWQVKEVFKDTFKDLLGLVTYRIERSERALGDTRDFVIKKIFTAALTDNEAVRTEDNLKFIKFPRYFGEKTIWDGNVYCDQSLIIEVAGERMGLFSKKWNYEVLTYAKAEKIGTKDFTDILTVRAQSDTRILTERRYNLEKYAKGVGLVYKEQHILDTQKLDASIAWEKKAEKGYIVKQTIVSF